MHLILIKLFVMVRDKEPGYFVIGSEYGSFLDANSSDLLECCIALSKPVYVVKNSVIDSCEIKRGGFLAALKVFNAKAVFYSHSISDVLPHAHHIPWLINKVFKNKFIFIQHGIIGLKLDEVFKKYLLKESKCFDKMLVSSEEEREIVIELGIPKNKLIVSGSLCFDNLTECSSGNGKVLIFFTWSDLASYENKVAEVLQALLLKGVDKKNIIVLDHPMVSREKRINISNIEQNEFVNTAGLLITDNSSMAWGFFYRKASVIFYKPKPIFHPSYKSMIDKLNANTEIELLSRLSQYSDGGLYTPKVAWASPKNQNCERLLKAIE